MFRHITVVVSLFCAAHLSASEGGAKESPLPTGLCSESMCYVVLDKLGEGAFGKVYKVRDENGHLLALKTLERQERSPYGESEDSTSAANLMNDAKREYAAGQKLDHPNIIHSVDLWINNSAEGNLSGFIVLDLVNGATLYDTASKSLTHDEVLENCAAIVDALEYGFSQDLIHLDLHWGNVMIDDQHRVMVIDLASFFSTNEIAAMTKSNMMRVISTDSDEGSWTATQVEELQKRIQENTLRSQYRYLMSVTEICVGMIQKSSMSPAEKVGLQSEIEKVALRLKYEYEDGQAQSLESYFAELRTVLTDALTLQVA